MLIPCSCGEASEPQRGVAVATAAAAAMAIFTIACEGEGKEKDEALGPQRQSCYVPSGYVTRSPGKYNRRVVVFSPFCVTLPVWYVFSATRYHLPYSAESFFCYPLINLPYLGAGFLLPVDYPTRVLGFVLPID
jgi:hypothetical protein